MFHRPWIIWSVSVSSIQSLGLMPRYICRSKRLRSPASSKCNRGRGVLNDPDQDLSLPLRHLTVFHCPYGLAPWLHQPSKNLQDRLTRPQSARAGNRIWSYPFVRPSDRAAFQSRGQAEYKQR